MAGPTAKTQRMFLAIWPDELCKNAITDLVKQIDWPAGASVYAPQDWHMTLHFLGSVEANHIIDLESAVDVTMSPVTVTLDQLWHWHRGLVVLAASVVPEELIELHACLGQRLKAIGLKAEEGAYRPHLTLARKVREVRLPDRIQHIQLATNRFALVVSTGNSPERYKCVRWLGIGPTPVAAAGPGN